MQITKRDVAAACRVYWWLLLAPIIAVPCWIASAIQLYSPYINGNLGSVLATSIPLIFYLPIFFWSFSSQPFLKAHARQGMILLTLRFLSGLIVGVGEIWGFLLCNAFLWLVGSLVGIAQAEHGNSWLDNIHAEIVKDSVPLHPVADKQQATAIAHQGAEVVEHYLNLFRTGNPIIRKSAAQRLEELGQVEIF